MNLELLQIIAQAAIQLVVAGISIASQWMLELRREKRIQPDVRPKSQSIVKEILKDVINLQFVSLIVLFLLIIFYTVKDNIFKPIDGIDVILISFQMSLLVGWVLFNILISYHFIVTKHLIKK